MSTSTVRPKRTHLELCSGTYLDYTDPQPEDIRLEDIARALSQVCRWAGHSPYFYSVAQHACLVHDIVRAWCPENFAAQLLALHHDDHEAYVGDVPTPLKGIFGEAYNDLVNALDVAIWGALDLPWFGGHGFVKQADNLALFIEAASFKPSKGLHWEGRPDEVKLPRGVRFLPALEPNQARLAWLRRHEALTQSPETTTAGW